MALKSDVRNLRNELSVLRAASAHELPMPIIVELYGDPELKRIGPGGATITGVHHHRLNGETTAEFHEGCGASQSGRAQKSSSSA
jgi:hypothetical protein